MKKRNSKKDDIISHQEMLDIIDELAVPVGVPVAKWLAFKHFYPEMHRHKFKVKRKNGNIEAHILFSDGSIHDSDVILNMLKKGDRVLK